MTNRQKPPSQSRIEVSGNLSQAAEVAWTAFRPPPRLTVSEWADRYRRLSTRTSAAAGRWRTKAYQREPMDAVDWPGVQVIVLKWASQVGKSEILLNILGRYIHLDACPMLMVQPTVEMAQAFSKDRIDTMIECVSELAEILPPRSTRNSANTVAHKTFAGGSLSLAGANSPAGLASRPIRILQADEVDRYPLSAGIEGNSIEIALKRLSTYGHLARAILVSSPTIAELSNIDAWYQKSDKRRFHVPCGTCGAEQPLVWANVKWADHTPETARYECDSCRVHWDDRDRHRYVEKGVWVPEQPEIRNIVGFHASELLSPWRRLAQTVDDFLRCKSDREKLQVWTNTALGECFEDESEELDPDLLYRRREHYRADVQNGSVLTAGVDVQDDRLEVEIVSWGEHEESWSVGWFKLIGNPAQPEIWMRLEELRRRTWVRADGAPMHISLMGIDSGGHYTDEVYQYSRRAGPTVVLPTKGHAELGKPLATLPAKPGEKGVYLTMLGVDTGKELLMARLGLLEPGPGYCHWPISPDYSLDYFEQLTAEKAVITYHRGHAKRQWIKRQRRNEALDCRVINQAMIRVLIQRSHFQLETIDLEAAAKAAPLGGEAQQEEPGESGPDPSQYSRRPLL